GVAVGFRAHTGWAAAVALDGAGKRPAFASRALVELKDDRVRGDVYHFVAGMDIDTARSHIDEAERVGAELAGRYLDELGGVTGVGVVMGSGRPLPELERILPVHALLHAAEGVLFREVIVAAAN